MVANIASTAIIADNVIMPKNITIEDYAYIGENVILEEGVFIGKHAVIGKKRRLAKSSTISTQPCLGKTYIGKNSSIGVNSIVMQSVNIGNDCVLGDMCFLRENVKIDDNVMIGQGVTIENDTSIGSRTKIQAKAYITAYSLLGEDVFIAPCVVTTNDNFMGRTEKRHLLKKGVTIRNSVRIGGGAVILPGILIDEEAVVGAGSVVTHDVSPCVAVWGNPAREKRIVNREELLNNKIASKE